MHWSLKGAGAMALLWCATVHAGVGNDIPSCYAVNKLPVTPAASKVEVFVLVDQTTPLDPTLRSSVFENVDRLIKPGSSFVVSTFSAFNQGRYLQVLSAGTLEDTVDDRQRDSLSVKSMRNFDECMSGQAAFGRKAAADALGKATAESTSTLSKSDIMGSLAELSARVKGSTAHDKIVLVVSDMLEYSAISSFYSNRNVRVIDPPAELAKARSAQVIGDFGSARVFVLGAGLVDEDEGGKKKNGGVYRNPKSVALLKQFWDSYFRASHATLVEFGSPALLSPVR